MTRSLPSRGRLNLEYVTKLNVELEPLSLQVEDVLLFGVWRCVEEVLDTLDEITERQAAQDKKRLAAEREWTFGDSSLGEEEDEALEGETPPRAGAPTSAPPERATTHPVAARESLLPEPGHPLASASPVS